MRVEKVPYEWNSPQGLAVRDWHCGNCGKEVSSKTGYHTSAGTELDHPSICICPGCRWPTFFYLSAQHPGTRPGDDVEHLPDDVARIYDEARDCCKVEAFDAAALLARTLLMHIAVSRKAKEGLNFTEYVSFLEANHFTPPDSKDWVDHVRQQGGRAAHAIAAIPQEDAEELILFLELILRYLYEFPGRMKGRTSKKQTP